MTLRTSFFFPVIAAFGLAFGMGCKPTPAVDSTDVATHGMSLQVESVSNGSDTSLKVWVWVGDADKKGTIATLVSGDQLMLKEPTSLARVLNTVDTQGQGYIYGASLPALDGDRLVIDFTRSKSASALGNSVTMPPAFTLTGPSGTTVKRSEMAKVQWNAGTGSYSMHVAVDGDCLDHQEKSIAGDPGSFVFNAGEIQTITDARKNDSCAATITVYRDITTGTFSAEFGHTSTALTRQVRSISFTSAP